MALRSCALTHAELIEWSLKLLTFYVFLRYFDIKNTTFYVLWVAGHVFSNTVLDEY